MKSVSSLLALLTIAAAGSSLYGQQANWSEFRAGGSSHAAAPLPLRWSPDDGIAWQRELDGYGQSTPIIYGERIFVTSVEGLNKETCNVACFDLHSGGQIWRHRFPAANQAPSSFMMARAAPTPLVDARAVYLFFESGDVAAIDHEGHPLWRRDLVADFGAFDNNHGLGASPTQTDELVFVNIEHRGPSYLIALDKKTGDTRWKTERPSSSSWSSPIALDGQIIVSSSGAVTAYDAQTGKQLWNIGDLDGNSVPSPTPDGDRLYVGARIAERSGGGDVSRSNLCITRSGAETPQILWRAEKAVSDFASPVVCGQCVYYLNNVGVVYCLDKLSGDLHYAKRIGAECWGTPIVSENRVYFFGKDGRTVVLQEGAEFQELVVNTLWDRDAPPAPESYVENVSSERRSFSLDDLLEKNDADKDGYLTKDELPGRFQSLLAGNDKDQDGRLDAAEIEAAGKAMAERRASSQENARDPIVYGAAAAAGRIVIRTGTRLYCLSDTPLATPTAEPLPQ
ncbi:PQQ-binding-like beta-propeller repeat protein [Blastopirellula sp. JC732]|uniref:PQQ-binding-like beta-propeller repeat protein n=1 Tax=Blastopirellula sediminis TaxID=2894196 RepID=A0A9X1SFP2_9BACT|nr:PQQ-binding-like beta-propeller repeat protein [Blastopirellula sediminis]MCC9608680.1 PQQ-binding-like beta-propeller repeat protein [Blastopirellula sediminis]MCC9628543.1 PQQ-binding-like beta-propeller repeat protein [Blastopirellula sediminis]